MGGFNPDFSVAFIPVIINNYTEYDLELFQFNDKAKNYTHFPEEVKKYSTGHGFIYDNLQEPMQDLLHNNTDVWLQYTFDNGRQTPFIFHILCRPGDINYTLTKYNGIQTAIRIAKGIVRLIPKVGKVAAFLMTLANIGLTIDNLQRYKQNFYFLAYPYSWKMPEVPTMFWYTDSLRNISKNSVCIHGGISDIDTGFVTENTILWNTDQPNYPGSKGHYGPQIAVNIYQYYIWHPIYDSLMAGYIQYSPEYNENPKLQKLVDHIINTGVDGLQAIYSELSHENNLKTTQFLQDHVSKDLNTSSPEFDTRIDEILKLYKLE